MNFYNTVKLILESYSYEEEDYWKEFNWYRENGIGEDIDKETYLKLLHKTKPTLMNINEMKSVKNSIISTGDIDGRSEEERLNKFKEYYKKTKREPYGSLSGTLKLGDVGYLDKLIDAVRNNKITEYPIVLLINGNKLMAGGNTRLCISYCLNKPIRVKYIKVNVTNPLKAKKVFNMQDMSIK